MVHSSLDDRNDDSSLFRAAATGDVPTPNHTVDGVVTRPDEVVDSELVARASVNAETTATAVSAVSAAAVAAATSLTSVTSQSLQLDAQVVLSADQTAAAAAAAAVQGGHDIDAASTTAATTTTRTVTSHNAPLDLAVSTAAATTRVAATATTANATCVTSSPSVLAAGIVSSMGHSVVASSTTELAAAARDNNSLTQFGVSNIVAPSDDDDDDDDKPRNDEPSSVNDDSVASHAGRVPVGHVAEETMTTRPFYKQAFLPAVGTDQQQQQQQQEYGSPRSRPNPPDDIPAAFYKQAMHATNDMTVLPVPVSAAAPAAAAAATRVQVDDTKRGPDRGNDGTSSTSIGNDLNVNGIDKHGNNLLRQNAAQNAAMEFEDAPMVVPLVPVYDGNGHLVLALPIQAVHGEAVSTETAIVPGGEVLPTEEQAAVTATSHSAIALQVSVTSDPLPNREFASTEMSNEASRHGTETLPMTVAQRFHKALSHRRCKGIVAMFALVVVLIAAVSTGFCLGTSSCAKKAISPSTDVTIRSSPTLAPAPPGREATSLPSASQSQALGVPTAKTLQPAASAERAIQIARFINNVTLTGTSIAFRESIDNADDDDVTAEEIALHWLVKTDAMQLVPNTSANRFQLQQRYALATLWAQLPIGWSPAYQTRGHECEWVGILCNSTPTDHTSGVAQVVTSIAWNGTAAMKATISADLGLLSSLVHFAVRPGLFGSIPSTIGLWTDLEYLDVSESILSGALPESIGRWSNLKHFDVSDSALSGSLPELIQEWSNLEFFDVSGCLFALSFEPMRQWSNLKHFDIGYNLLSGTLPDDIGQWTSMQHFDINGNSLSGIVPSSIGKWSDVQYFALDYNSLTGPLPLFSEQWTTIEYFNVYGNTFTGILPEFIASCVNLKYFDVFRSALNGTLSDELGQWTNLEHFDIGENGFVGSIPQSFGQWTLLEFFAAYANTLTGSIPAGVSKWTNVRHFEVGFNSLSGNIPNAIGQWTALEHFDVSTNFLNGTLPEYAQWPELQYFSVGDNALNGTLPAYFANSTSLEEATFYLNDFSGSVPSAMCNIANLTHVSVDCPNIECDCCTECP